MRGPAEWEPNLWDSMTEIPAYATVLAKCGHCHHVGEVAREHVDRVPRTHLIVVFRNKLRCQKCRRPGGVTLLLRKRPR